MTLLVAQQRNAAFACAFRAGNSHDWDVRTRKQLAPVMARCFVQRHPIVDALVLTPPNLGACICGGTP